MARGEGPTGIPINHGHQNYEALYSTWEAEGRPGQFDAMGEWGGAIFHTINKRAEYPTFVQAVSEGPTLVPEDGSEGKAEGWLFVNEEYGLTAEADGNIKTPALEIKSDTPPNELSPDDYEMEE